MKILLSVLALVTAFLFITTAPPTVYLGDGGEIISAGYTLGIGHPPGYPLYMLLVKISSLLPLGDVAFRANLLAAMLGVLVFLAFYFTARCALVKILPQKNSRAAEPAALFGAGIFAFADIFWAQTTNAKGGIYALASLAMLLAAYFTLRYIYEKDRRMLYAACYSAGFLPVIHQSTALMMLFAVFILWRAVIKTGRGRWLSAAGFFILSFITPYFYLFARAAAAPAVCWGDIRSTGQVLKHILRYIYMIQPDAPLSMQTMAFKIKQFAGLAGSNYGVAVLIEAAGFFVLFRKDMPGFYAALALVFSNLAALFLLTQNTMSPFIAFSNQPYYLVVFLPCAMLGAFAVCGLVQFLEKHNRPAAYTSAGILLLMPLFMAVSGKTINDNSEKFIAYDNAQNILKTLSPGDRLFVMEDHNIFNILYLQYVKHKYADIHAYDRTGNFLDTSIYSEFRGKNLKLVTDTQRSQDYDYEMLSRQLMQKFIARTEIKLAQENPGRVYYTNLAAFPAMGLFSAPYGLLYKIYTKDEKRKNGRPLMRLYANRDILRNANLDIFYRDVTARYFLQEAKYAALSGDREKFEFYRAQAEMIAPDSGTVLNIISSIYFYEFKDYANAIIYMEKIMALNPYEYGALNVLIEYCMNYDREKAIKWLWHFYGITKSSDTKSNILIQINKLSAIYK